MMSRIDRIRRAVSVRKAVRAEDVRAADEAFEPRSSALVPVGRAVDPRSFNEEWRHGDNEFEAQLLGQDGDRRGLRAGPSLIDRARDAYNRIEWSGAFDRRARKGARTRSI